MCNCFFEEQKSTKAAKPEVAAGPPLLKGATVSRRTMLAGGALGAAAGLRFTQVQAQGTEVATPSLATGAVSGLGFRAFVRHGTMGEVLDLRMRELGPRQVLVRCTASVGCYTVTRAVLGGADLEQPQIPNHSGFGIVEAVGPDVRRVRVGDRVLVAGRPSAASATSASTAIPRPAPGSLPRATTPSPTWRTARASSSRRPSEA